MNMNLQNFSRMNSQWNSFKINNMTNVVVTANGLKKKSNFMRTSTLSRWDAGEPNLHEIKPKC